MESKSFELVVEDVQGKWKGCIWERSGGVSSYIRFGEESLSCLLDELKPVAGRMKIESGS